MSKLSIRKPILCELLCLNFKRKNNIKRKRLWVWQISTERHSKGEFHVLVKALKLFHHEFFFKHIATWHFHFSQWCFTVLFGLIIICIQQFHWLIILSNNLFRFEVEFFSTPKRKKNFQYKENKLLCF